MNQLPALLVKLESLKQDPAHDPGKRGARKILVTELFPEKETEAVIVEWNPPAGAERCPVQVTENIEVAMFTQNASQDRHFHKIGTDIYTVLEGEMRIEVEGKDYVLLAGDMLVVNPGAVHEVKPEGTNFLCRVITPNCIGSSDKYLFA
jgi:quercetin dioxygenase-like cupin family protein